MKNKHSAGMGFLEGMVMDFSLWCHSAVKTWGSGIFEKFNGISWKREKTPIISDQIINRKSPPITDPKDLGYSKSYKKFVKLDTIDFRRHSLVIGASGFGKTNLFHVLFEHNMNQGLPVVFIDPKGNVEDFLIFKKLCSYYNRKLYVFSDTITGDQTRNFNPIRELEDSKIVSLIMNTFDWSDTPSYYVSLAQQVLLKVMSEITQKKMVPSLPLIYELLRKEHEDSEKVSGLLTKLKVLISNNLGKSLADTATNPAISIQDAVEEGSCVYISVNTQAYSDFAKVIGKMFVNEVLQISAFRNSGLINPSKTKPFVVFIDELGSVIEPNFLELINKCRSANIQVFAAVQSPHDLDIKSNERSVLASLWECFSNVFVLKQSNPDSCEKLSRVIGTRQSLKKTKQTNDGMDTGGGSTREVEEFLVHPNRIKGLSVGDCIFLNQGVNRDVQLIRVRDPRLSPAYKAKTSETILQVYKRDYQRNPLRGVTIEEKKNPRTLKISRNEINDNQ